jgi:hypothetical protein
MLKFKALDKAALLHAGMSDALHGDDLSRVHKLLHDNAEVFNVNLAEWVFSFIDLKNEPAASRARRLAGIMDGAEQLRQDGALMLRVTDALCASRGLSADELWAGTPHGRPPAYERTASMLADQLRRENVRVGTAPDGRLIVL